MNEGKGRYFLQGEPSVLGGVIIWMVPTDTGYRTSKPTVSGVSTKIQSNVLCTSVMEGVS